MSRGLSPEMIAALQARTINSELFYQGVFSSTTLQYWTGQGPIAWDLKVWEGNGKLFGVPSCSESIGSVASGISVQVSGVSEELVYIALNSCKQSSTGKVWRVFFEANQENVIGSIMLFSGNLDTVNIDRSSESGAITFSYESRLIRFNEKREIRLSNELHQEKYPGDKGLEYVNQLKGARIYWGRADPGRLRVT